jgi:hypothetical protein
MKWYEHRERGIKALSKPTGFHGQSESLVLSIRLPYENDALKRKHSSDCSP